MKQLPSSWQIHTTQIYQVHLVPQLFQMHEDLNDPHVP